MATVAEIWRHPIKSHGREQIASVALTAGQCLPWDRHWAVTHQDSKFDDAKWAHCRNFMIGARTPGLAGIWAKFDDSAGQITLRHQDLGEITFDPDTDNAAFLAWVTPLCDPDRALPKAIVKAQDRGMTDTDFPSVSLMNRASHQSVENALGHALEPERWRANIWIEGTPAWAELGWMGKTLRIGTAELTVQEPCVRCMLTATNPVTGLRDVDTLGVLQSTFGHKHFGVYAVVTKSGSLSCGDPCEVI